MGAGCLLITATERVRVVSSVGVGCEFTTPRLIPVAFGATACAITPVLTSRRSELAPGIYATDRSHPFSCSYQSPVQLQSDPRSTEMPGSRPDSISDERAHPLGRRASQ